MDPKSFQTMRLSGLLCDCTIQIVDKQLPVHGVVMASRCDYFRGLLQSGMQDANRVDLSNMPGNYDTMKSIVDFCYGISIQDRLDESNIAHVLCAASYLQMSGHNNLEEICGDKLKKLTKHKLTRCLTILYNCTDIGVVAEREGVTEKCMEAAVRHFKSYDEDKSGPTDKLCKSLNLENLPIPWMKQILEKMQQSGCDMSMITSVSTVCAGSIISYYHNGGQTVNNSLYSYYSCLPSAASPKTLLKAFKAIMSYVPDEASALCPYAVAPIWFVNALEFVTTHALSYAGRLYSLCASIYNELADIEDEDAVVYRLKPNAIVKLNKVTQANHSHLADCVQKLTDCYLFVQARRRSLTPSNFVRVVQSTDWCSRESFDAPFEALSEMLEIPQDVMQITRDEIANMVAKVDFTKLSQHMLERAAANSKIPREVIMMAAVNVCSTLRCQIATTSQALTKETKKSKKFKSALATANRVIEELQEKNETLQSRLQTEKDDNGLLGIPQQINGSWTPNALPFRYEWHNDYCYGDADYYYCDDDSDD